MTLKELYQQKLSEYKETKVIESYAKLLAMLLLNEKYYYDSANSLEEFYEIYKNRINLKIKKIEEDFNLTDSNYFYELSKQGIITNDIKNDKIWYIYEDAIEALDWAINYAENCNPKDIYEFYFNEDVKVRRIERGYYE